MPKRQYQSKYERENDNFESARKRELKEELEITGRLLSVRRELRQMVLRECGKDFILAEKYYAELFAAHNLIDLDGSRDEWPLAKSLRVKIYDTAKRGPVQLSANDVWRTFRQVFFGHTNWTEAEILARRLLWQFVLKLEELEQPLDEERETITHFSNMRLSNLPYDLSRYKNLSVSMLDFLKYNAGFRDDNIDAPSSLAIESWHRFRRLLAKHRSQVYSATL